MPKRNRALSIIFVPIAVLAWFIGWGLYITGLNKELRRNKAKPRGQTELAFILPLPLSPEM